MSFVIDDVFQVKAVDPDGKKFDRVSRIVGQSENYHMAMLLDVNVELYPMKEGERYSVALTRTISLDGTLSALDDGTWHPQAGPTLADKYEYVMWGRAFKMDEVSVDRVALMVSFGGLLMRLETETRHLQDVTTGTNLYLLMRRV